MAGKARIHAKCDKCGDFEVVRKRTKRTATSGEVYDLPRCVICPSCRMWAAITRVEEV
jgi:ssDNA-binding Zn-finger/Zn-ribbon topoisomerase 1